MPHRRHVAIVDDEASVRESLALLLSTAQIESRTFASAEDYLASVPLDESTCVILDNQNALAGAAAACLGFDFF